LEPLWIAVSQYILGAIITACTTAFVISTNRLRRVWNILADFPPHRHVKDSIIYPDGFEPTKVQRLENGQKINGVSISGD